jgi:hypothetical protein
MRTKLIDIVVPAVLLLGMMLPLRGGFTDDGFIHIQYARNLATRGEYSFNPGDVSFGTTSPLWVMTLAAIGKFFHDGDALITVSRVLSWIGGFAALVVFYALVLAVGGKRLTALLATAVFACDAWFARWTALGMETSVAVLAVLLVGLTSVKAWEDRRSAAFLGLAMALGSLVRPELYLAFPVYLFALLVERRRVEKLCPWATIAVAAALLVPWLVFAKLYIGDFVPSTAGAKSGGVVNDPLVFLRKFSPVVTIVAGTQALTSLAALASLAVYRRRSRLLARPFRFMLPWVVALPVAYVAFDMQVLSRYLLLVTPFVCVFGWIAIEELLGGLGGRVLAARGGKALAVVLALAMIAVNVGFYVRVVLPPSREFSYDLTHNMRQIAEYIRDHSDPDAVVAAADIGYLAFYSERRVLDLGGLVEPETGRLREQFTYEEIVERGMYLELPGYPRVDFFVDRDLVPDRFDGQTLRGFRFTRVFGTVVRNLGIRKPGPYHYVLYRLAPQGAE